MSLARMAWWRSLLWLALALASLLALRESMPNYDARTAPFVERGALGEYVQGRRFAARADSVSSAHALRFSPRLNVVEERDSSGVWLIVQASAMATQVPLSLASVAIRTRDGRHYTQTGRLPLVPPLLSARELQPGVSDSGVFVFELPADAIPGAVLVLAANRLDPLDSELQLDLGLAKAPPVNDFYDLVRP